MSANHQSVKFYQRISFWLLILFLVRLIGVTNPPLEAAHNWRQVTGLMVARNFLETNHNILYPRIDDNNGNTGIIGMEFPSLNYACFLLAKIFGYRHWYGRLLNLLVSTLGVWYFYRLLKATKFGAKVAAYAALLLTTSIWFSFSRKMMPDTYCIAIMMAALFYGWQFLAEKKVAPLLLYVVLSSLAVTAKIPAGIYLVIPLLWCFSAFGRREKLYLLVASLVPLSLLYLWYFWWNPWLSVTFGNWYNSGKSITEGGRELLFHYREALHNFTFFAFMGYSGFVVFTAGIFAAIFKRQKQLLLVMAGVATVFFCYIFKSGFFFFHHNYYIIPFVPVMALVAGYCLSLITRRWLALLVLFVVMGEGFANQLHDFFIKSSEQYKMDLERVLNRYSKTGEMILVNGNGNPQLMYLAHRKGWCCYDTELKDSSYLNKVLPRIKLLVLHKSEGIDANWLPTGCTQLYEDSHFVVARPAR